MWFKLLDTVFFVFGFFFFFFFRPGPNHVQPDRAREPDRDKNFYERGWLQIERLITAVQKKRETLPSDHYEKEEERWNEKQIKAFDDLFKIAIEASAGQRLAA